MTLKQLKSGVRVHWNDPDNGECSRTLTIAAVDEHIDTAIIKIFDTDGGELECYLHELSKPPRVQYIVAAYDQSMECGGREEGGWYYDAGSLIRPLKMFASEERASAYCQRLNQRLKSRAFGPNQGKREYSSVLSEGEVRAHVYENSCPAGFPERRPHYE